MNEQENQIPHLLPSNQPRAIVRSKSSTRPLLTQKQHFSPPEEDYVPPRPSIKVIKHNTTPSKQPEDINQLKRLIINKQDKIVELEYFNSFLQDCLKKKEELAKKYNEDNLKLREELFVRDKIIQNLKDELKKVRSTFPVLEKSKSIGRASTRRYGKEQERIVFPSDDLLLTRPRKSELRGISPLNLNNFTSYTRSDKGLKSSRSTVKRTEEDVQKVLLTDRGSIKITEVSESLFSVKNESDTQTQRGSFVDRDLRMQNKTPEKVRLILEKRMYKTVTETQGRRGSQSLFLDNFNRLSFLQLSKICLYLGLLIFFS